MLHGLFMLLSLSTLMAIASFLAGLLPLSVSLSQSQFRLISAIGMGVLVGTSLIVIIPEGIETLYTANGRVHQHIRRQSSAALLDVRWHYETFSPALGFPRGAKGTLKTISSRHSPIIPGYVHADTGPLATTPRTPTDPGEVGTLQAPPVSKQSAGPTEEQLHSPHAWVGISLILGFILMYLIDTLPALSASQPQQQLNIYSLSDLSSSAPAASPDAIPKRSLSTTIGLVIHAAADGIALGASSTQPSLSFIVFLAVMVHKAPAAFGLTSVLLKQGLGKRQARAHLLAFSLAAPVGALLTWLFVRILGGGKGGASASSTEWWTGIMLLFSGGTFLYVAMHTMQEEDAAHKHDYEELNSNGYLDSPHGRDAARQRPQRDIKLVGAAVMGMLLPLITQIGHAH